MAEEVKGQQKIEKPEKGVEIKTRAFKQGDNEYSLGVDIEDAHIDVSTFYRTHHKGNSISLTIFDMTTAKIKALGQAILEQAVKLEMEAE